MSTAEANDITITNVGPIEHLTITVPPGGGLVVLRGANGKGKSHALKAVQATTVKADKLPPELKPPLRDGADRGEVEFDGVRITVGRRTSKAGELDVATLEGRFDLGELVDPGIVDPAKADARRIKALLNISQRGVDPEVIYQHVLPQEALAAATRIKQVLPGDDPITLAETLRRDLQETARQQEEVRDRAAKQLEACLASLEGVDLDEREPPADAVEKAAAELARIEERHRLGVERREAAQVAREKLEAATPPGCSVEAATAAVEAAKRRVVELTEAYAAARQALRDAEDGLQHLNTDLERAEQHERFVAQCREAMAADDVDLPSGDELASARGAVASAKAALERYGVVREATKRKAQAETWRAQRDDYGAKADRLRKAAANVDVALSALVSRLGLPLFVKDGRLMTSYVKRGDVPFAELSDGERYRIALDVAIAALSETEGHSHKLLILNQAAYESLDQDNRQAIAQRLAGSGVVVITAEATIGDLVAETV